MRGLLAIAACILVFPGALAFKLKPAGSSDENVSAITNRQALGFLQLFTSDVHERITRRAYEKAGVKLPDDVIVGVRWNDNPPAVRLGPLFGGCNSGDLKGGQQMECWVSMLRVDRLALETVLRREKSIAPLRSHFGDMQFLHAMAPRAGESPQETREKILRWSEFAYRIARGEIGPRANVHGLRENARTLETETAAWIGDLFRGPEKQLWTVQDIFLSKPGNLRLVAFGSLLHLVEDSYSASHVQRVAIGVQSNGCPSYDAEDEIAEFHTYAEQDTEKHALCDDAPDWLETPRAGSPVEVLAELVRAHEEDKDWLFVKKILEEKVFRFAPGRHAARAGRCFERRAETLEVEGVRPPPTALEPSCRE
jgi:hypothetical protein